MKKVRTTGRKAGQKEKRKSGRPARKYVDNMAAVAWITDLKRQAGNISAYAVGRKVYPGVDAPRFDKYDKGEVSPRDSVLTDTEKAFPGSRLIFDNGPEGVELWDAIDGDYEKLWSIIDPAFQDMKKYRQMRSSHRSRAEAIINSIIAWKDGNAFQMISERKASKGDVNEIHCVYMLEKERHYPPATAQLPRIDSGMLFTYSSRKIINFRIDFRISDLAALIAMWRLSMLVVDCADEMDYVLSGLMIKAIPDLLEPYGVGEMVVSRLKQKRAAYLSLLEIRNDLMP